MYQSTKTFTPACGLSAAFRQHRAESHCKFIHGYALGIKITFEAAELDVRNWVVDFGSLKTLKDWIERTFDHKLLIAQDDPWKDELSSLAGLGIADTVIVEATGCEAFAEMIYEGAVIWLKDNGYTPRCRVVQVEVFEHGANSAIYIGE